jgi:hypothetical protein
MLASLRVRCGGPPGNHMRVIACTISCRLVLAHCCGLPDRVWFALTQKSNLDRGVKQVLERVGKVITYHYSLQEGTRVAASMLDPHARAHAISVGD